LRSYQPVGSQPWPIQHPSVEVPEPARQLVVAKWPGVGCQTIVSVEAMFDWRVKSKDV